MDKGKVLQAVDKLRRATECSFVLTTVKHGLTPEWCDATADLLRTIWDEVAKAD